MTYRSPVDRALLDMLEGRIDFEFKTSRSGKTTYIMLNNIHLESCAHDQKAAKVREWIARAKEI